jgi:diguanylate cyclase (GGDEF)-like protein
MMPIKQSTNKTLLVVDDSFSSLESIIKILQDYDLIAATTGQEALDILQHEPVDLALMDIVMPDMDGFTTAQKIKSDPKTAHIPIIFITGQDDEKSLENAFRLGGVDYIRKPVTPLELRLRVDFHLQYQNILCQLNYIANHDALTGIFNRRSFFLNAKEMFTHAKQSVFAMMIDIDFFKAINDEHGHATGDRTLIKVAHTIAGKLPENAIFGRIGGEEFAVLQTGSECSTIIEQAQNCQQAVAQLSIGNDQGQIIHCSISTGIAQKTAETDSLDALLRQADLALYQAKNSGRNRFILRNSEKEA